MTGYSLHIGLNHVDPAAYGGWDGALSGCINDANSMRSLAAQQMFNATQLIDGQATSQAVIGEIALLAQQAVAGDICLITYSGHGGQVDDQNGDEPDLRDETWVLYDRQVVDDELFQMWSQFAAGVRLLVLSDSCHSGTVARNMIATAGRNRMASYTREVAELATVTAVTPKHMPYDVQRRDNDTRRGTYQFVQALSGARETSTLAASLILISGCQDNQLSYDGPVNGQFTGTLLQVWGSGTFHGDYSSFHSQILAQMPPDQSPNLFTVGTPNPAFMAQRPFSIQATAAAPVMPTPTNGDSTRPILSQGSTGPDVAYLQQRLNAHGASLIADGVFGQMTTAAVQVFQSTHGLPVDGVVGPMTWNALGTVAVGTTPSPATTSQPGTSGTGTGTGTGTGGVQVTARPMIGRGSTGEHVQYLQGRLVALNYHDVIVDGIFGPGTERAVRSFQRSNSLPADGIVGQQTWSVLG
ncbi:MAG: peptidoglycan-binding protein [Nocardioides sp.]